ncbi:glycine betaine/carnitine transport ATP-binding protein GbuA [Clostridium acetireducens DSM 10703]|uniref:Quaternary amine transport ATP-binding protein n=1 Tax=Clostridium acetireducens DSM 10703 TaxID=1121290 RepID=A0A1E8EYP0_9CLOT|nr:glycine betaine/L-proline ABC transporter ATP-binding protein [Clostridium acetireducens]OFI06066.1 glycine betaine/carnitine transport ATP-binding protein GbuA [Clostridium acetireducens DSM 10703]
MYKIQINNLYKIFGKHPKKIISLVKKGLSKDEIHQKTNHTIGINNVNFQVNSGEFFVVMGLSGSGKSTLIRCLNRLIKPTYGEILIDGKDINKCSDKELLQIRRKKMAMVFQNFALLPHRDVCSNVAYGLEIQGVDEKTRKSKSYEALELVGLKGYENSMPSELSGGMQQRVGLARALATNPDILLMDEAFSALDPLIRREMQEEILELQSKMKKTIIFITHDLDEALRLGDRIAIMKDGAIEQIGAPEEILTNPATDYVKAFLQDVNRTNIITASSIIKKSEAIVSIKDGPKVAMRLMKREGIASIYVIDKDRKLKGIVKIEDVVDLIKKGIHYLDNIIIKDVPTTSPDTPISDLLSQALHSNYPIVVVDKNNTMLGIIKKSSIIAGILGEEEY